jgi:hypothetical protein
MEFDFSPFQPRSDLYGKIVLLFDAGAEDAGETWYFDDIRFEPMGTAVHVDPGDPGRPVPGGIRVLYDVSGQRIRLEGAGEADPYMIYSLSGVAVLEGRGRVVDVRGLGGGAYLVRTGETTLKFIKN